MFNLLEKNGESFSGGTYCSRKKYYSLAALKIVRQKGSGILLIAVNYTEETTFSGW